MSRQFVKFSVNYFLGTTGVAIREAGGDNAVVVGAYLLAAVDYLGLQRMHLQDVADDLGKELTEVEAAIDVFERVGFARYDRVNRVLWIVNGAKYALGVPDEKSTLLKKAVREFADVPRKCPFRREFHAMYAAHLRLEPLEQEVVEAPAVVKTPAAVAAPMADPASIATPAPIKPLMPPPAPMVAPGSDIVPPPQIGLAPASTPDIDQLARFNDSVLALKDYRVQRRSNYPQTGDAAAIEAAARINAACGPHKAADLIEMSMGAEDLDLKQALSMVFGDNDI
jgi:hypothetical protein